MVFLLQFLSHEDKYSFIQYPAKITFSFKEACEWMDDDQTLTHGVSVRMEDGDLTLPYVHDEYANECYKSWSSFKTLFEHSQSYFMTLLLSNEKI